MSLNMIIDVETTGLPQCDELPYGINPPYENLDKYDSARMVQITFMICNEDFEEIELQDFIIKSDGFSIDNSYIHGITNEISENQGKPFSEIANIFSTYLQKISNVIAHNANFDISIIKSELYRAGMNSIIEELNKKNILCSMIHTKYIVNATNDYGIKNPSLAKLYNFATKKEIKNAHNSKYDVINLHEAIKILIDSKQLKF